jgi:hypothetical protein
MTSVAAGADTYGDSKVKTRTGFVVVGSLWAVAGAQLAQAAAFNLTDTVGWKAGAAIVSDTNPSATVTTVVPTVSFGIANAFNQSVAAGTVLSSDFPSPSVAADPGNAAGQWNFYGNYVFSLNAGSTIQSALVSFTLPNGLPGGLTGISNLEARIVQVGPTANSSFQNGAFDSIAPSDLGNTTMTIVDGWQKNQTSLPGGSNYYSVMLNQHQFGTGLYALQIRGEVASSGGLFSGSYGGSISFTPVPLPPAVWLLGGGLLAAFGLKRWLRQLAGGTCIAVA